MPFYCFSFDVSANQQKITIFKYLKQALASSISHEGKGQFTTTGAGEQRGMGTEEYLYLLDL